MNDARQPSSITQEDIDLLLERLKTLQTDIAEIRRQLDPLEAELVTVQKEFSAALNVVLQKIQQQKADIRYLHEQMEPGRPGSSSTQHVEKGQTPPPGSSSRQPPPKRKGLDEETKSELSEHIVLALDEEQEELQARINSLCSDPALRLADVLEEVPWGIIWKKRTVVETLRDQYRRLETWEKALTERLEGLKHASLQLQRGQRYTLWQEYQKGPLAWRDYLEGIRQQRQMESAELEEQLQGLRTSWKEKQP